MKAFSKLTAIFLALCLMFTFPLQVLAAEYDLAAGSVTVNATEGQDQTVTHGTNDPVADSAPVITQSNPETSTSNTITITGGGEANVTIQDVNIVNTESGKGPIDVQGSTTANVTISGSNTVTGNAPGVKVEEDATIIINGGENDSLVANGGYADAGIGSSPYENAGTIIINGGNITANGGDYAAGIGGGASKDGGEVIINGGTVVANGGTNEGEGSGAGIGGGSWGYNNGVFMGGSSGDITITGGTVTATGGNCAAGIGGGAGGSGENITITGGTVTAQGGDSTYDYGMFGNGYVGAGAGIGSGGSGLPQTSVGESGKITITGGTVYVVGGNSDIPEDSSATNGSGLGDGTNPEENENITINGGVVNYYIPEPPAPQPAPAPDYSVPEETPTYTAPAPAPTVVEAEAPVSVALPESTVEVTIWVSSTELDEADGLIVETVEAPELTSTVEEEKIVGVFNLSLKSGEEAPANNQLNFNLGTAFAGQSFTLVYFVNGQRIEVSAIVGLDGIITFPLTQMTVVMLIRN